MAVLYAHLQEPLPIPRLINPAISEDLQNVILKAMAKDPGDRYQTAAEMGSALRRAAPLEEIQPLEPELAVVDTPPVAPAPPPKKVVNPVAQMQDEIPATPELVVASSAHPGEERGIDAAGAPAASTPETAAAPQAEQTPYRRTIMVPGLAVKKLPPSQGEPLSAAPRKKTLTLVYVVGVVIIIMSAVMARNMFTAGPDRTPQASIQALTPSATHPPQSAPTLTRLHTSQPSATQKPTAMTVFHTILFDNFDNPDFEGMVDPRLWSLSGLMDGCFLSQKSGVLSVGNQTRSYKLDCSAGLRVEAKRGADLQSVQAFFRVAPGFVGTGQRTALAWTASLTQAGGSPTGAWNVKCGVVNDKELSVSLWIQDTRLGSAPDNVYQSAVPFQPGGWSRLRLQLEPDTMTFSCWMANKLVGTFTPTADLIILMEAAYNTHLYIARPTRTRMTVSIDDLEFLQAEAAAP